MEQFARKCSVTGKGMNEGYVFVEGDIHFSSKEYLVNYLKTLDWEDCNGNRSQDIKDDNDLLEYFYREDQYYYTNFNN